MKTTRFLSFVAIFAIVLTFFACTTSDLPPETQGREPSSSSSGAGSNSGCTSNDLGKGYDVIGSPYINWTDVKNIPVLDNNKMCKEGILDLGKSGGKQEYAWFSGSTIEELYSSRNESMKISTSLGATVKIPFVFSAGFETKFAMNTSNSSQQSSSKKYFYSQVRSYLYTEEDQIKSGSESARNLSKYLTDDFISDLKSTKSAGTILDRYGSHVFIQYFKGGSLEANYTYTVSTNSSRFTSSKEMETAAKFSFSKVDAAASTGTSGSKEQMIKELEDNMSFNYQTYGGKELKSTEIKKLQEEYGGWVSSIRDNARVTGIKDFAQSFIPIWDLAEQVEGVTSARIDALIEEFEKRAEAQEAKFPKEEELPTEENCTSANNTATHYCSNGTMKQYGSVTDKGGKTYKTVVIGEQTWMAQNLNYNADGSRCYKLEEANCTTYGRLYNWKQATSNICPSGWHLPSDVEWGTFLMFIDSGCKLLGDCPMAGKLLKTTSGWDNNGNGTNAYGFAALPSGKYISADGSIDIGKSGTWWTSTESSGTAASGRRIEYDKDGTLRIGNLSKDYFYSVRCLKD
ncbi:MAG: fibrobacter succinogenes major paralogous domain-containing protein [Fibromonadales bacterium]|nr:fibrobacter succinogenes major paralogous domain-containing protein [Fibromonadales bacterium]